jgi:pilus assembly protein Flp/PilA
MFPLFNCRPSENSGQPAWWLGSRPGEDGEEGQGLVEYALILLLVAIVVIVILVTLGPQIGSIFSAVSKGIS